MWKVIHKKTTKEETLTDAQKAAHEKHPEFRNKYTYQKISGDKVTLPADTKAVKAKTTKTDKE